MRLEINIIIIHHCWKLRNIWADTFSSMCIGYHNFTTTLSHVTLYIQCSVQCGKVGFFLKEFILRFHSFSYTTVYCTIWTCHIWPSSSLGQYIKSFPCFLLKVCQHYDAFQHWGWNRFILFLCEPRLANIFGIEMCFIFSTLEWRLLSRKFASCMKMAARRFAR